MSTETSLIEVRNLGKRFRFYSNRWAKLRGSLLPGSNHAQELWALRDINLNVNRGTTLGVIGFNGSGKTTLLQILASLLKPTEGSVSVHGRLATLLELGSSFQSETTGRENIFVSAGLSGFSRRDIERKVDEIVAFSELEEFIDRPVKHYSSGMLMRLAFATAINVQPDVLLIDEVFAVGDMAFQHKCTRKLRQLQDHGATIVIVTHDMLAVKSLCNLALLLDHGKTVSFGNPEDVTNKYLSLTAEKIKLQESNGNGHVKSNLVIESNTSTHHFQESLVETPKMHRHGSGEARIRAVQILNSKSEALDVISFGEEVSFLFHIEYFEDVQESGLGFYLRDKYGNDILGINTFEEKQDLGPRKKGDCVIVEFKLHIYLRPGSYSLSPGLSYHPSEPRYLDWIDSALFFQVDRPSSGRHVYGFMHVQNQVSIQLIKKS